VKSSPDSHMHGARGGPGDTVTLVPILLNGNMEKVTCGTAGGDMTGLALTAWIGVALGVFITGTAWRLLRYLRAPVHLRWDLYPVAHEPLPRRRYGGSYLEEREWWTRTRRRDLGGEIGVMAAEILLLKGVRDHNRRLWRASAPFHWGALPAGGDHRRRHGPGGGLAVAGRRGRARRDGGRRRRAAPSSGRPPSSFSAAPTAGSPPTPPSSTGRTWPSWPCSAP